VAVLRTALAGADDDAVSLRATVARLAEAAAHALGPELRAHEPVLQWLLLLLAELEVRLPFARHFVNGLMRATRDRSTRSCSCGR
jgi:hypothetical protein